MSDDIDDDTIYDDIELQDMSADRQPGEEENNYVNLPSRTPPNKTGPCISTIVCYRCAVLCLGVLCVVLVISIRVLWLKTTSDANQMHTEDIHQLQLLQKTCKNFTEVSSCDNNTELETSYNILSREKSELETNYNILSREKSQLETNYCTLSREKSQLETNYNILSREKSQLETNYNILSREKSLLETNYNTLRSEKSQSETNYNILSSQKSQLQERCDALTAERDAMWRRYCAIRAIAQHAVDVTLDPDTAHNKLILSADGKQVEHGDTWQNRPDNPKRFDHHVDVLGTQGFSSGRFYYEVQVSGKTKWYLGVARESVERKEKTYLSPTYGLWTISLMDSQYYANAGPTVPLSLREKPERVGVFVDYGAGVLTFYDADRWSLMYSYKGASFREKIYPYFSPDINDNGKNSAPLVITPVSCRRF